MIVDRNDEPLAISTPVESVAASPADVALSARDLAAARAAARDATRPSCAASSPTPSASSSTSSGSSRPRSAERVVELGIPGIFLQREYRRYYPAGEVMAHLIGFTDVDDDGQEAHRARVRGRSSPASAGSRRVIKDRLGHIDRGRRKHPRAAATVATLALSIDARIQYLAYRELKSAVEAHRAKAGGIVVLDAATGEVLALANLPSYNPNNRDAARPAAQLATAR